MNIFGRSLIHWLLIILVAICVFILAKWLIPLLFGMVGFPIPDQISTILALLIAIGVIWGGYGWRTGPPA